MTRFLVRRALEEWQIVEADSPDEAVEKAINLPDSWEYSDQTHDAEAQEFVQ